MKASSVNSPDLCSITTLYLDVDLGTQISQYCSVQICDHSPSAAASSTNILVLKARILSSAFKLISRVHGLSLSHGCTMVRMERIEEARPQAPTKPGPVW